MLMTKNIAVYGLFFCILILQTSCMPGNNKTVPVVTTYQKTQPSTCGNLLDYDNELPILTNDELPVTGSHALAAENGTNSCIKLGKAIKLSMPNSDHQNDSKALALLKELKHSNTLSDSDQRFNNFLLQHVSQRQHLRKIIGAQEKRLKKSRAQNTVLHNQLDTLKSQLNQLKNIEVEIDKKERSVTSPIGE